MALDSQTLRVIGGGQGQRPWTVGGIEELPESGDLASLPSHTTSPPPNPGHPATSSPKGAFGQNRKSYPFLQEDASCGRLGKPCTSCISAQLMPLLGSSYSEKPVQLPVGVLFKLHNLCASVSPSAKIGTNTSCPA